MEERGEFLIERDIDDNSKVCINAGGLKLSVPWDAFVGQARGLLPRDPENCLEVRERDAENAAARCSLSTKR